MENIYSAIDLLLNYGQEHKLIGKYDRIIAQNSILEVLKLLEFKYEDIPRVELNTISSLKNSPLIEIKIHEILDYITNWAIENKIIQDSLIDRELLDTKIMGILTPNQTQVINKFMSQYASSPEKAAKYYYNFSKATNYIRMDRINKNMHWYSSTEYGNLEITINLSKPEKDPKDIEREKNSVISSYPKCLLCYENVGYTGRINHPARQNHRIIPVKLTNEEWFLQYSPYVYYNEHAILFCKEHRPMKIDKNTFKRLIEFVDFLPNYFIGSNADLPIVGGSILSHDHLQGGNHEFPMEKANIETKIKLKNYPCIEIGNVKWPMSVLRLKSENKEKLIELSNKILQLWRNYSDEELEILAFTGENPHNTITPIARRKNGLYEMDLVLRNNRTTEQHPLGLFHPHSEVHHIKKENIGLIEVMGLAVLPGRLKDEMKKISEIVIKENSIEEILKIDELKKHAEWINEILNKIPNLKEMNSENIENILKENIGLRFSTVLEHAGVFKRDEKGIKGFLKFMNKINEL